MVPLRGLYHVPPLMLSEFESVGQLQWSSICPIWPCWRLLAATEEASQQPFNYVNTSVFVLCQAPTLSLFHHFCWLLSPSFSVSVFKLSNACETQTLLVGM